MMTVLITLIALPSAGVYQSDWMPGIIHCHTTFSDGSGNIPQRALRARQEGCLFMIVTDHNDEIPNKNKPSAQWYGRPFNPRGVDVGFADYVRECREQTCSGFVCIPGLEIAAKWQAEDDTLDESHTLALGAYGTRSDRILDRIQFGTDQQVNVIRRINQLGMLSVAAHPKLISTLSATFPPWEWQRNRYDLRSPDRYAGIQGIEFFNDKTDEQETDTLEWYLSMVRARRPVFVTAGNDSHGWGDLDDDERWQKKTWIKTTRVNANSILDAISHGYTCATAKEIRIVNVGVMRPYTRIMYEPPKVATNIECDQGFPSDLVIYRDGIEMYRMPVAGQTSIPAVLADGDATVGVHWYVLYMKGALVSSPIIVDYRKR